MATFVFNDFSGGLDWVTDPSLLDPRFTRYAYNMRIVGKGIEQMAGYGSAGNSLDNGSGVGAWDSHLHNTSAGTTPFLIAACGTKWVAWDLLTATGATGKSDIRTGMTSTTNTTFASFGDKLYGLDPSNNIAVWTGSGSATAYAPGVNTGPPQGIILGIWQNKMWVAKATAGNVGMRVEWSDPADPTNGFVNTTGLWPADNYVEIGATSGGSERIVGGMATPDGLVVFTNRSMYLIYDDSTGAYSEVDSSGGLASRRSLAVRDGVAYGLNRRGIFRTNGRSKMEYVSDKIAPFFTRSGFRPDLSSPAAVIHDGSYFLSLRPNDNQSGDYNRLTFELRLDTGAIMQNQLGFRSAVDVPAGAYVTTYPERMLYVEDGGNAGRYIRGAFSGTNGMAGALYQLPPVQLTDPETTAQLIWLDLQGRGAVDTYPMPNLYSITASADPSATEFPVQFESTPNWDYYRHEYGRARVSGVRGKRFCTLLSADGTTSYAHEYPARLSTPVSGAGIARVEMMYQPSDSQTNA